MPRPLTGVRADKSYSYRDLEKMTDSPCWCLMRAGDFGEPDPPADEGNSDARELARDR